VNGFDYPMAYVAATVATLLNEPGWVFRRVEQVEFLGKKRLRRRVSVDFTMPDLPTPDHYPDGYLIPIVPLALLRKDVLRAFDVRDEAGRPIPVLTRSQNAEVTAAWLLGAAEIILGRRPSADVQADIKVVAGVRGQDRTWEPAGTRLWIERGNRLAAAARRRRLTRELTKLATIWRNRRQPPSTRALDRFRWAESSAQSDYYQLWANREYQRLLTQFSELFLLLAHIAVKTGERRILKYEYDEGAGRQPKSGSFPWWWWTVLTIRAIVRMGLNLFEYLGFWPFTAGIPIPTVMHAESYHIEVEAPQDVCVYRARLRGIDASGLKRNLDVERRSDQAHLYSPRVEMRRDEQIIADLSFALRPSAFVWAAWLSTLITSAVLIGGLHYGLHQIKAENGAGISLIVALPVVFAAYLFPREGRLAREMFGGLRILILLASMCSFVAAATLAPNFPEETTSTVWSWLRWIALASFVVASIDLLAAYLLRFLILVRRRRTRANVR
jgi:hypothetical protein